MTVDGVRRTVDAPGDEPLLDVLRDDLHLTGSQPGCGSRSARQRRVARDGAWRGPTTSTSCPCGCLSGAEAAGGIPSPSGARVARASCPVHDR